MNASLTEIAFILDRSGSMASIRYQAIAGFNHFLADQVNEPGDARLTLVLFDDEYLAPVVATPLRHVVPLDTRTYVPRHGTALLDAIGRTVDELGERLANTPEPDRPGQVIVAILTDGEENSSRHFKWADIAARISHQREKYHWQFLFLGANQDAIATAARMNIGTADAANFRANEVQFCTVTTAVSRKMKALRRAAAGQVADPDLAKSMQDIVHEEENPVGKTS